MSDTTGHQFFHRFVGLEAARKLSDAWIVMPADWGGQVLLTCPIPQVNCDDKVLHQLHCDLLSISWGNGALDDGSVDSEYGSEGDAMYVFTAPPGHGVPGGMGGGANLPELWVHQEFIEKGLQDAIRNVLCGSAERLPPIHR